MGLWGLGVNEVDHTKRMWIWPLFGARKTRQSQPEVQQKQILGSLSKVANRAARNKCIVRAGPGKIAFLAISGESFAFLGRKGGQAYLEVCFISRNKGLGDFPRSFRERRQGAGY